MGFDGRLLSGMSVLAAVVETGSFTRAGDVLGLSASGVSRAVSRLEKRMGIRLLDRTTRALHLTGEGARLYELAAPHLSGIEEAANVISGAATTARGALRVSLNPLFSRHVLAPRLPEFKERYPELELISVLGRPKRPEKLAQHDCIQYIDPQRGKPFSWEFQRGKEILQVETTGRLTLTDADTMVGACVAGAGIAQVLALGVEHLIANGALIELFPEWPGETFPLHAIRPSRRLPPAAVEAFLDFCGEICDGGHGVA